ncbi:SdrD B-like domain-containing protein [Arundinibacter roseus]|uniref:SD-repeat containing protein B domain-containing protein n=1 Tax=Arundinibacter roseus TaxID=2070510 RepID=A0A4R4JVD8_9BACT|nr:SdrD B-like domain-containing protein [Arundinibacter roseus]TDB58533.1 hypothetical protein EZE20_23005 [Arundinibacter roseus]
MKQKLLPCILTVAAGLLCQNALAQVGGRAYQDLNANGKYDSPSEKGISQIKVLAYDRMGQLLGTSLTDTIGLYSLSGIPPQPLRIEFEGLPVGFHPTIGQYLNRFIDGRRREVIDLGLYQPTAYVSESPKIAVSIQPMGDHTDSRIDSLGISTIRILMSDSLVRDDRIQISPKYTGCIWGLTYDRSHNLLYSAALAKRHSGFGPLGSGGIYKTNLLTGKTIPFASLDSLGGNTGPKDLVRDLSSRFESPMNDSLMFPLVGKMGLGGIDLSKNKRILYTVSLFDRKLYSLQLPDNDKAPTSKDLNSFDLAVPRCRGGTYRPFAVKSYKDKVYVGGVCDAQRSGKSKDLIGYVHSFDPETRKMAQVISFPLNYERGTVEYGIGNWFAWTDNPKEVMLKEPAWWAVHPQPILSDIEFDSDGSLIIGLMDRLGHQMASGKGTSDGQWKQTIVISAGDVLRATPKRKNFSLEANASVGRNESKGHNNEQGPQGGEFYFEDIFSVGQTTYHQENGMGGLAILPNNGLVLVSSREPIAEYNSAGISAYDNVTGKKVGSLVAYQQNSTTEFVGRKSNHIGDVEVLGAAPPTLLGHRVWQDCNENGLQDADEVGLSNVKVGLWRESNLIATTQTDSLGIYYFDSRFLTRGLNPGEKYELRIPLQQEPYGLLQIAPSAKELRQDIDNDALEQMGHAVIPFVAPVQGENMFNLDFGFKCVNKSNVTAELLCNGTDLSNATIALKLDNYTSDERYDLTPTPIYTGRADHSSADQIPDQGLLQNQPLASLTEIALSIRIFNVSGCYKVSGLPTT